MIRYALMVCALLWATAAQAYTGPLGPQPGPFTGGPVLNLIKAYKGISNYGNTTADMTLSLYGADTTGFSGGLNFYASEGTYQNPLPLNGPANDSTMSFTGYAYVGPAHGYVYAGGFNCYVETIDDITGFASNACEWLVWQSNGQIVHLALDPVLGLELQSSATFRLFDLSGSVYLNNTTASTFICSDSSLKAISCPNQPLPVLSGVTGSIGGSSLAAGACLSGTATISGVTTSMVATADPATYPGDAFVWKAYASGSNTVTVKVCAITSGTPTASTYNVRVLQ